MSCAKVNAGCPDRLFMDSVSNEFEKWLEGTEISDAVKDYFKKKTDLLKKHNK